MTTVKKHTMHHPGRDPGSPENGFMEPKYKKRFGGDWTPFAHLSENMMIDS